MRNRRSFYRAQRARDNKAGGMAMAMYRLEQREKRRKENNRISKRVARDLGAIGRGASNFLLGSSKRRRGQPRRRR
jgi:hypothetical protein